jgi:hypothetical protein
MELLATALRPNPDAEYKRLTMTPLEGAYISRFHRFFTFLSRPDLLYRSASYHWREATKSESPVLRKGEKKGASTIFPIFCRNLSGF